MVDFSNTAKPRISDIFSNILLSCLQMDKFFLSSLSHQREVFINRQPLIRYPPLILQVYFLYHLHPIMVGDTLLFATMCCRLPSFKRQDNVSAIKLPTSAGSWKKQESSRKISISALLAMPKPLTVWITINCGKF